MAEVSKHDSKDSAWLVVSGKVFDVTEWVPLHPGERAFPGWPPGRCLLHMLAPAARLLLAAAAAAGCCRLLRFPADHCATPDPTPRSLRSPAGGERRILKHAGTDATRAFDGEHGVGGTEWDMLQAYLIGVLA